MGDRIPTLEDLGDVSGKRVLVRTDFNVPMDHGRITDDFTLSQLCWVPSSQK